MASVPKRIAERLVASIQRFQPILCAARSCDVSDTATATIVKGMLADLFGYDQISEVPSMDSIRGTFRDLATKIGGQRHTLIDVKRFGLRSKRRVPETSRSQTFRLAPEAAA